MFVGTTLSSFSSNLVGFWGPKPSLLFVSHIYSKASPFNKVVEAKISMVRI